MKTTAAVSREGLPAPVIETLDLEAPRAGEVLIRIVATGVCHTDLRVHAGLGVGTPRPVVLGRDAPPQFFIPMLIDYYRQGRLPFDRLIRFYRFDEIAAAFHDMHSGDAIKPVLRME